ncbi:MAG: sodium:solute symporter family protein [Candidatus Latescibacterota bacterium]|nr:sodium:solute symporter family protein [Candidatus Latescibacterota bacterium]
MEKLSWLILFTLGYWSYCIYWGIRGARQARTASDYFIAGRTIGLWVFVLAATATSFSGWTFVGHPGTIFNVGLPYAFASFYAITIPFTGVMFLKRQWLLGKRYGYITPGEMFADYYKTDSMRLLTALVAMIFSVPYLGIQLRASGLLFSRLVQGTPLQESFLGSIEGGAILLSVVVFIYVASGGLRSVAYVDCAQCILLAIGIIILGFVALDLVGGWANFKEGLAGLASVKPDMVAIPTRPESSSFLERAGTMFLDSSGGAWTGVMILTYMFALMGIQAAPAFSMWAFANKSPKPFPWQQVFASSLAIGGILFVFTAIQGLSGSVLFHEILPDTQKLGLPTNSAGQPITDYLVPYLIASLEQNYPWLLGLLCVCALAAMQSTGAAYMSTASGIITRDIYRHFFKADVSQATQVLVGRLTVFVIVALALMVGLASGDLLVLLGGAAVSYGLQMWPALLGICYFRWFTPQAVVAGLIAGIIAVTFTYVTQLGGLIGIGRYPLTIHSAGWGILFNLGTCILVSAFTQARDANGDRHRQESHGFLRQHTSLEPATRRWKKPVWALTAIWFLFAIGPFAVLGNESDPAAWSFGIPTLWIWQIVWWIVGVIMMYLLAFKLEMSTEPRSEVKALVDSN